LSERTAVLGLAAAALLSAGATPAAGQDWHTVTSTRQVGAENLLRVDVEYGAGRLVIGAAPAGTLYRSKLRYDQNLFEPRTSYRNGLLRIGVDAGRMRGRNIEAGLLDLALSPEIPVELELRFGAAEAALDLGGLRVRHAKISTGASRTALRVATPNPDICRAIVIEVGAAQFTATGLGNLNAERLSLHGGVGEVILDFTGEWKSDMTADVAMGLGALTLRIPRGVGVRVRKGGILAGFDSQGLIKRGDVYFSEDWDSAERKLTIDVDAALGSVRVAWVDG